MHNKEQSSACLSQRKQCFFTILFLIVALFYSGLTNGICNEATASSEIRVGSELEFPPYAFVDETGQPAGFSVDLIKAVADAMGMSIHISTGPWDTVWNFLAAGRLDVLPIVAKLPERIHVVDFSLPHTETFDSFFVRAGSPFLPNIAAARGKEIVVMRSDAAHHALLERNFQGNLILVNTIPEGLQLISSGKYDAFLCSKLIGTLAIKQHGLKDLNAGPPLSEYKRVFSFAVRKGDTELLEKLNQGLMIIKTNDVYDRIYEKWLTADDPWWIWKKYFIPFIMTMVAFALIAGFWLVILKIQVKRRTRELAERNAMLLAAQENLEEKVARRTTELSHTNAALQSEVSERKQAEDDLKQANVRLKMLNEELESFIYSVSHDLRAPLRSIGGFAGILIKGYAGNLDDKGLDYLVRIHRGTGKMAQIIDDLLRLSRISQQTLERTDVDLSRIASSVVTELHEADPGRSIEINIEAGLTAFVDPRLMEIALSNLLGNAWKFTSKTEDARIEFGAVRQNGQCVYFVKDTGVGFEPEYANKMFRPFQRLHTDEEFEGTGIGLAIVERVVHQHGGNAWAESEPGKGAIVYFTLQ